MQFNSIQFDSILLLHFYTTLFLPSRRHCDLHHKRSTLIDFRCLCHLLFNIWNPAREHNSCIKTTPQFNSIQFYYYTSILLHLNVSATADYAVASCMASSAPHGEGPCALRRAPRHRHRLPRHRPLRRRQASSTSSSGLPSLPAQVSPQGRTCGKTPALHPSVTPSLYAATASGSTSGL